MKLITSEIFFFFFYKIILECRAINENDLIISLIYQLGIKHCIVVDDDYRAIASYNNVKYFAGKSIHATFMDKEYLMSYLEWGYYVNVKTAIVIKTEGMIPFFNKYFNELNADYVMSTFTWIMFDRTSDTLAERLRTLYIPYNCEFLIIIPISSTYYKIDEVYNIGVANYSQRQRHQLGFWSREKLSITTTARELRRYNMMGEPIFLATPFPDVCYVPYDCCHAEVLGRIASKMNSTPVFFWKKNATEETWEKSAGYVTNMVYHTKRPLSDILGPILDLKGYLHIKGDGGEEYGVSAYLEPFSKKVWIYILISILTSSIVAWLVELKRLSPKFPAQKRLMSSFPSALRPFETMCNQYGSKLPKNPSSRLAWLSIQISASILIPAYSAAVISFITISIPRLPFTDLESFLELGTYKTSGIMNTFTHTYFEYSTDEVVQKINEKLLVNDTPEHNYEAVQWLCRNDFKYAYVAYNNDLYLEPNDCKILQIPKPIFSVYTGSQLNFNSPYTGVYKRNLYQFYSAGIIHKMRNDLMGKMPEVVKENFTPLTLNRVGPLLFIIILGNVAALVILFLEIFIKSNWH